ncbi:hypothetical protein FOQG_01094 [Fusarium oxysporum f. sp. raphani 54005]|uniref:Uncharacterized protein n=2 Tax=Fusarium oxysporum TaxID=5507 RepID=X0DV35_FUSOX|nr:hypothetical protein FOVG_08934 [Fusarium oxysporum f. sp. pisi HDV247]EXK98082.1 hypothetical protein FOQG_01094 [Fusarium oxysporum f. sp. raphani 54005]
MQKEFWAWRGGRKKTTRTRVDDCSYSCIHPSKPATSQFHGAARSLDTSRHPGAACHPAPSRPGYTITVRILNRAQKPISLPILEKKPPSVSPLSLPLHSPLRQRSKPIIAVSTHQFLK